MDTDVASEIICAHRDGRGAWVVMHYGSWLPVELIPEAQWPLTRHRAAGHVVAQSAYLKGDGDFRLVFVVMQQLLRRAKELGCTHVLTVIGPHDEGTYKRQGFRRLVPTITHWTLARNADGVLLPVVVIFREIERKKHGERN